MSLNCCAPRSIVIPHVPRVSTCGPKSQGYCTLPAIFLKDIHSWGMGAFYSLPAGIGSQEPIKSTGTEVAVRPVSTFFVAISIDKTVSMYPYNMTPIYPCNTTSL